MENSPSDSIMKMEDPKSQPENQDWDLEQSKPRQSSGIFNVFIAGLALFSDGYNAHSSMSHPLQFQINMSDHLEPLV